jgi:hypothetical protein
LDSKQADQRALAARKSFFSAYSVERITQILNLSIHSLNSSLIYRSFFVQSCFSFPLSLLSFPSASFASLLVSRVFLISQCIMNFQPFLVPVEVRQIGDIQCNIARLGVVASLAEANSATSKLAVTVA